MDLAVDLRSVVARVGRFPALAGVDLSAPKGSVVAVVGHNGAGKTSLLRVCAGLIEITAGEALVLGHDLRRDAQALRRTVGLLGHDPAIYEELSAKENAAFALRAFRGAVSDVDGALERVGIVGRLATMPVGRLSAGQRRRCALGIQVARRPPLWLLDEPHMSLDPSARDLLAAIIDEAARDGATIVFTSHDVDLAASLADSVVSMAGGVVVEVEQGLRITTRSHPREVADADVA